jgi:hypothetical protein
LPTLALILGPLFLFDLPATLFERVLIFTHGRPRIETKWQRERIAPLFARERALTYTS